MKRFLLIAGATLVFPITSYASLAFMMCAHIQDAVAKRQCEKSWQAKDEPQIDKIVSQATDLTQARIALVSASLNPATDGNTRSQIRDVITEIQKTEKVEYSENTSRTIN